MTRVRLQDIISTPGLLTVLRAPLAAAFPFAVDNPFAAFAILVAAGLSDMLDGWFARRSGGATAAGAILDPAMDKLFVISVVVTLLLTRHVSPLTAVFLSTREILQLPLALWLAFDHSALAKRSDRLKANMVGKACTALQFGTIAVALVEPHVARFVAIAPGIVGVVAAVSYWAALVLPDDTWPKGARNVRSP